MNFVPSPNLWPQLEAGFALEREFCEKYEIPQLPIKPTERLRGLLAYRNDRRLYRRVCDATGASLISAYRSDCGFKIINSAAWWGESWDGLESAIPSTTDQSFFSQFSRLQHLIPREGTTVVRAENSDYNSHTRDSRNCYLSHLAIRADGLLFSYWTAGATDVLEGFYTTNSELCARCSYVTNCYGCVHLVESSNCHDCYFSSELRSCSNCLFCSNLSGKQFHLKNRPCTKVAFEAEKAAYLSTDESKYRDACAVLDDILLTQPRRAQHSLNCEEVLGEHILNSRRVYNAFDVLNSERCFNITNGGGNFIVHSYSVGFPECEHVYCSVTIRSSSQIFFCSNCWSSHNLWYCDNCVSCTDCFACVGLKHRRYCIFNREYSQSEYEELFTQWRTAMLGRGEWGTFFPLEFSPFCYDESAAQDFFPLDRDEIARAGGRSTPSVQTAAQDPKNVASAHPDARVCIDCGSAYKVVAKERDLAMRAGIPLSPHCPECRLANQLRKRSGYSLHERECSRCGEKLLSALSSQHARSIWCDNCYTKEVF